MKKIFFLIFIFSILGIFIRSQTTEITTTSQNCDITLFDTACHSNKNCAFVQSRKNINIFFACLAVQPKDCNFFCNYFNELNTEGNITTVSCICNGIKYPNN